MKTMRLDHDSPTRTRTRVAILKAALRVLGENTGASLGEVADAAQVARSTLHRYFPERSDLLAAMRVFAEEQIASATSRARIDDGRASDALLRLVLEYFDQWDAIVWAYLDSQTSACAEDAGTEGVDPSLTALIARGQAEGSIDPTLSNAWIQNLLWALLYTAWEYIKQGATKHEALTMTSRTLSKMISPDTTPSG